MSEFPYYSPTRIRTALRERGGAPLKRRGQNFLIDPNHVRLIADEVAARASVGEHLLEIGPGLGALTANVLDRGLRVHAVEIDPVLADLLEELLGDHPELEIIRGDARELLIDASIEKPVFIYGNLPYYITTELLLGALAVPGWRASVFLVQDEFARRLVGGAESSLSVFAGNLCAIRLAHTVPAGAFFPAPDVKSSLLTLDVHAEGPHCEPETLERLLRATYQGKRKTIRNNWKSNAERSGLTADALFAAAEKVGLDLGDRPEAVAPETYYKIVREITE